MKIYNENIKYVDRETNDELIFNFYTWIKVIEGILVNYANKNIEEATNLIEKRNFLKPESYIEAVYYSHDTEYHWAMMLAFGDNYWLNGVSSQEPNDYNLWDKKYKEINSLKKDSFEFT